MLKLKHREMWTCVRCHPVSTMGGLDFDGSPRSSAGTTNARPLRVVPETFTEALNSQAPILTTSLCWLQCRLWERPTNGHMVCPDQTPLMHTCAFIYIFFLLFGMSVSSSSVWQTAGHFRCVHYYKVLSMKPCGVNFFLNKLCTFISIVSILIYYYLSENSNSPYYTMSSLTVRAMSWLLLLHPITRCPARKLPQICGKCSSTGTETTCQRSQTWRRKR